jgi:hypothetical protein
MTIEDPKTNKMGNAPANSSHRSPGKSQGQDHPLVKGVSIIGLNPESRAEKAGLQKGDLIIAYDGVGNLTTDKLAALSATTTFKGAQPRVVFVRDGREDSLTLSPGSLGISAMDTTIPGSFEKPAIDNIERIVQNIQRAYLVLAVLGLIGLPHIFGSLGVWDGLKGVVSVTLDAAPYFALRYRWVGAIPLVLIVSAFSCISCFFIFMSPAMDLKALLAKVIILLLFLFYAYQIRFFRRADVRAVFRDKGTLVF